jgi:uncharacterized damage-inducible protein DinB
VQTFFRYNWIIREQWYQWSEDLTPAELLQRRTGGVGSILLTLFHIADVEWSWIRLLQGKTDFQESFENYNTLEQVRQLDALFRLEVEEFVNSWDEDWETRPLQDTLADGSVKVHAWGGVMRHVIAHQIHHMGQLSVWARELGRKPVSANLIDKGIILPAI